MENTITKRSNIMKLQQKFALAQYIASKENVEYEWGINDCNTLLFEFHDSAYGTNMMSLIKYRDPRAAMKFAKGYMGLQQWMNIHDYTNKPGKGKNKGWREGDLAIQTIKPWYNTVFIFHNGVFWSMTEGQGLKSYTPKSVELTLTSAWRKLGGEDTVEVEDEVYATSEESETALAKEESDWIDDNTCEDCKEFPCECDRPEE
jgi:hypothetical protein